MKNKHAFKFGLALLTTLALVACNQTGSKSSSPAEPSSSGNNQPSSSVNSEPSSQPGGQSSNPESQPESSNPASSPASDSTEPAQSSEPSSQPSESEESSEPEDSSTNPWGGWSGWDSSVPGGQGSDDSQSIPQPQPQVNIFTVTAFEFEKGTDNKVSLVIRGTVDDSFEGTFTWAWGLATNDNNPEFIVGSAEPQDSDFQAVTVAEKAFEVKMILSDIALLQAGNYRVYGGNPDSYGRINPINETSTERDANFKYFITSYNQSIVVQELPPVALEEAVVYNPDTDLPAGKTEGIYVKLGGTVKAGTNVDELTVRYDFQNIRGNTRHPSSNQTAPESEYFWIKDNVNNKAYLNLYIGFMAAGEQWATHLGFNITGSTIPNCFMANDIDDVEYKFVDENKVFTVNAKESEGQQGTYWGCLGFAVTQEHEPEPQPQPQPIISDPHTWVAGTPGVNSDSKVINNYTCSDDDCNAVSAGIDFLDHNADDDADIVNASGQIKKSGVIHWKIVAPKAGACKLFMASKLSSNWETYASQRTENNGDIAFDSTGYAISAGSTAGVVTMAGKFYQADFGFNLDNFVYYEVGTLTVEAGENLITFETPANQSFRLYYGEEVRLVFED